MRAGQASGTAMLVAAGRSIASRGPGAAADPRDALATRLLPGSLRALTSTVSAVARAAPGLGRLMVRSTGGLIDHVALRAVVIDVALSRSLAEGCRQVVIVGAGLDTRAHRLPELSEVPVFELDHPASQAHKQARVGHLPPAYGAVRYVPIDLAREDLGEALGRAGHDPTLPTSWLWEGVIFYLAHADVERTLGAIAQRSAPGSRLIASYRPEGARWPWHVSALAGAALRILGEPIGQPFSPDAMRALLARHDFAVQRDLDPDAWFNQVGRGQSPTGSRPAYERLVVAERKPKR